MYGFSGTFPAQNDTPGKCLDACGPSAPFTEHSGYVRYRTMRGFSLVELSIVLVILGLLTGGILGGQALIRAAELRAVSTEASRYVSAAQSFRGKYFALPGDMTNAQSFWGTKANCGAAAPGSTGTCNGDGDGFVDSPATGAAQTGENFMFWQQLGYAGMIEGSYTGIAGAADINDYDFGTNAPRSRLSSGGWQAGARTSLVTGSVTNFDGFWRNWIYIVGDGNGTGLPLFKPEESWNIDTKMDDGKPGTGKVVSRWDGCTNAANSADFAATYLLSTATQVCDVRLIEAF